jgi:pyruvate-formate lyase-activating enzyme
VASSAAFFVTTRCQNRCRFCFERPRERGAREVAPRWLEGKLDALLARGVRSVDLVGGEPLLHPEFLALAHAVKGRGLRLTVTTNGLALANPALADAVLPLVDALCLSLHGGSPAAYAGVTANPRGFALVRRAIDAIATRRPAQLVINTTVTAATVGHLTEILDLVAPLAPVRWDLTNPLPLGSCAARYRALAPRLAEVATAAARLVPAAQAARVDLRFSFFPACAVGYLVERCNEVAEPAFARGFAVDHDLNPHHRRDLTFARGFGPVCGDCSLHDGRRCHGVPLLYLETFGGGELHPAPARP